MKILWFAVILFFVIGCTGFADSEYQYRQPKENGDGLRTGTLSEAGFDNGLITKGVNRINGDKYGEIHSVLIYKKGKLVLEEYFDGHDYQRDARKHYGSMVKWDADKLHSAHSVSKSITSLCVGIAVDKGIIKSVNQSIFDYLPKEYAYLNADSKNTITIEHLLTCTSGLQWAEWSAPLSSRENDQIGIWSHEEGPVDYVLRRPFVAEPGKQFNYSGGGIDLLGVILENASGMSLAEFSDKYLFEPLGIKTAKWDLTYPTGELHAAGGLKISPRDMVKIGAMMLNNGTWNGNRIVSEGWVGKCKASYANNQNIKIPGEGQGRMGYSYTWWTKNVNVHGVDVSWYSANGWGGQKIIVLPELETVIVFTGANYTTKVEQDDLLDDYILAAMK